ncbi:acyltransferase family protein [Methylomagnum sp.]
MPSLNIKDYPTLIANGAKLLALAPLVYLGRISYGLYVYHIPVLQGPIGVAVHGFLGLNDPVAWRAWLVDLPITIGIAALSWRLFEQPILRLKERFAYRYG